MTVGDKIYTLRTQAGFSQEEFAEVIGVSRQSISKWETSAVIPDTEYIVKICKVLHVSADMLIMDGDLPEYVTEKSQVKDKYSHETMQPEKSVEEYKESESVSLYKMNKTLSIVGFVFSFLFGIVGLIISCVAFTRGKRNGEILNYFAISGIAISSVNIYATIVYTVINLILFVG